MNYAALVTAIQDYTANTDATFVANIPNFVKAAEKRIYYAADLPVESFAATTNLTPNDRFLQMPANSREVQYMHCLGVSGTGDATLMLEKDVSFVRECYPNAATTGQPKFFARWDQDTLLLAPTPDLAYQVEMQYLSLPESIVTAGDTWLGDEHENTLLYGALVEAYTFMKGDEDLLAQYASLLADGVAALRQYGSKGVKVDEYRAGKPQGAPQ